MTRTKTPHEKTVPVQAVKKALDILDILVFEDLDRDGVALGEIAARMGMHKNSAFNIVKTLLACGYARRSPGGGYAAGERVDRIGQVNDLLAPATGERIDAVLDPLSRELGESLVLTALIEGRRAVLRRIVPDHPIVANPAEPDESVFNTPTGRVLMAHADAGTVEAAVDRHGLPDTRWDKITSRPALNRMLERVRRDGRCVVTDEKHGLTAMAVPVTLRAGGGPLVAALGCFAPTFRCPRKRIEELTRLLRKGAAALTEGDR